MAWHGHSCCLCGDRITLKKHKRRITSINDEEIKQLLTKKQDSSQLRVHVTCANDPHKHWKMNDCFGNHLHTLADAAADTNTTNTFSNKENIPPSSLSPSLKRNDEINIPYTSAEQQHVLKRLRLHHTNPDGTLSLQSSNHTDVKLLPLPTPHVGSYDCSYKTRQRRSKIQEQLLQHLSIPSTVLSTSEQEQHQQAQLTSLIERNRDIVTTSAKAAGLHILHKLSVNEMIQLEKATLLPYSTTRVLRSFFNNHNLPILPSEHQVRKKVAQMIQECEVGSVMMEIDGKEENILYARASDINTVITICPMCLVTRDDIKLGHSHSPSIPSSYLKHKRNSRSSFEPRTTEKQNQLYTLFQQKAHGNISIAKDYGNVIHPPLMSSEIHLHLAALPLHILLGTTKKAMDIIGEFCAELDEQLQSHQLLSSSKPSSPQRQHIKQSIRTALNNIAWHDQCIQDCGAQQQQHEFHLPEWFSIERLRIMSINRKQAEEELLRNLEEKWYSSQGHFSRLLDDVVTLLKVKRQSYHGGAFVGNDCVRLLKGRKQIADVLQPQQFESLDGKSKYMVGSDSKSKLGLELLSRLYSLHDLYSLSRPLCDHEVQQLTSLCHEFGCWFPANFPKHRVTPKMHVMIYHMPELAQKYHTVGMFSEQAGEAIHTVFNKLNRQYVYLGSNLARIESVMNRCIRLHDPRVLDFVHSKH